MGCKTENRLPARVRCPKCGGRVFLDKDYYGWYAQCLLCGHLQNLEKAAAMPAGTGDAVKWLDKGIRAR